MTEIDKIADQLRRAHAGDAWHGPSLDEILKGVTAQAALLRPIAGAHNIWELVLHVGAWESVVRRRLSGEFLKTITPEQDWPPVGETTEAEWQSALGQLRQGHEQLQQAIARLTDRSLREAVPGMGYNVYFMLHGAVQHALYHAGQMAILKKASG